MLSTLPDFSILLDLITVKILGKTWNLRSFRRSDFWSLRISLLEAYKRDGNRNIPLSWYCCISDTKRFLETHNVQEAYPRHPPLNVWSPQLPASQKAVLPTLVLKDKTVCFPHPLPDTGTSPEYLQHTGLSTDLTWFHRRLQGIKFRWSFYLLSSPWRALAPCCGRTL
jgi:hypothetical protein